MFLSLSRDIHLDSRFTRVLEYSTEIIPPFSSSLNNLKLVNRRQHKMDKQKLDTNSYYHSVQTI